ncbi:hypothetical protein GOODEAATRI_008440 [Goodea atripinnis]|uniref:Transposase Tc1-like domain-containing protein n=1 Tax=Goodea atripinnis TaxID=208336 RepID=A0ABV0PWF1_9TELE
MARKREPSSETCQSILVLRNEGYSRTNCQEIEDLIRTDSNQNKRRSWRPRCTTEQEDKHIRVSSLRNRHLTGPHLAASLDGTRTTPVSTSTVKMRLQDAGILGRVAKKKPYLRLEGKGKDGQKNTNTAQGKIGKGCYGQINQSLRCLDHKEEHL